MVDICSFAMLDQEREVHRALINLDLDKRIANTCRDASAVGSRGQNE
jgi:hypothetical protein